MSTRSNVISVTSRQDVNLQFENASVCYGVWYHAAYVSINNSVAFVHVFFPLALCMAAFVFTELPK
jgi:hypothetical protein